MWRYHYRDYPADHSLREEKRDPGKGVVGCEMRDLNGWGESYQRPKQRQPGIIGLLLKRLFGHQREKQ